MAELYQGQEAATARPRFSADGACFGVARPEGAAIYWSDPPTQIAAPRRSEPGGIAIVAQLERSSLVALVARAPSNRVALFDCELDATVAELVFDADVLHVQFVAGHIAVALRDRALLFTLDPLCPREPLLDLQLHPHGPPGLLSLAWLAPPDDTSVLVGIDGEFATVDTGPGGAPEPATLLVAVPGVRCGQVRLISVAPAGPNRHATRIVAAHKSALAQLALAPSGELLATASERGTLVRIFDTRTGHALQELRRGVEPTAVLALRFSADEAFVVAAAATGSVHIYRTARRNRHGQLRQLVGNLVALPEYLRSSWAFAKVAVALAPPCDVALYPTAGSRHLLLLLGGDGSYYRYSFDSADVGKDGSLLVPPRCEQFRRL